MNLNVEQKLYEISSDVKLLSNELSGRGGLFARIESLEKDREEQKAAYWKGIGIIAGVSAASNAAFALLKFGVTFLKDTF